MDKNDGCGISFAVLMLFILMAIISAKLSYIRDELAKQARLQTMAVCVTVPLPECKKEGVE
jgi:hypothetical protein